MNHILKQLTTSLFLSSLLLAPRLALAQPPRPGLQQQAETAQKLEQYPQAESLWQEVIRQHPTSAEAYYNLGLSLHHQLKLDQAIDAYQNATRLNAQYGSAYVNLGLAWMQIGKYDEAKTAFEKAIASPNQSVDPANTHTLAHYNLAILLKRQGKQEAALQETQKALALTPKFGLAQELLEQIKND
ncbi:MAG: tetratricopeptide repeat protein [Acaryochloridaceae cyanobacterium CSU_3_4]|nr:tetratricopeptide repeat protein [Acaryochloridaceae cyanobacterium CSU_3_4]